MTDGGANRYNSVSGVRSSSQYNGEYDDVPLTEPANISVPAEHGPDIDGEFVDLTDLPNPRTVDPRKRKNLHKKIGPPLPFGKNLADTQVMVNNVPEDVRAQIIAEMTIGIPTYQIVQRYKDYKITPLMLKYLRASNEVPVPVPPGKESEQRNKLLQVTQITESPDVYNEQMRRKEIGEQLYDYLEASLGALTSQLRVAADPNWIFLQSADSLATLHSVIADRTARLLAGLQAGQQQERAAGEVMETMAPNAISKLD